MAARTTLLVDNGSLAPAATLQLRRIADELGRILGEKVEPVSLLHSSGIDPAKLGGVPAEILEPALRRRLDLGLRDFLVLPMFFGPSRALTDYIPERVVSLRGEFPDLRVRLAAPLHGDSDDRLARILADHVRCVAGEPRRVALVDHGSPLPALSAVRDQLARQLGGLLGAGWNVAPCSMERRPGREHDHCEPLLAGLLRTRPWCEGEVVVAMQFLSPGRHAGHEGDVAQICLDAGKEHPRLATVMTPLVGEHPLLLSILADRWRAAADAG